MRERSFVMTAQHPNRTIKTARQVAMTDSTMYFIVLIITLRTRLFSRRVYLLCLIWTSCLFGQEEDVIGITKSGLVIFYTRPPIREYSADTCLGQPPPSIFAFFVVLDDYISRNKKAQAA